MIEFKNLTKRFDKVVAVDNLCLDIKQGTVLGLVGSNGSGKSTLLRMLSGVFAPDEGEILLDGESLFDNPAAKGKCYFIPDFPYFYNSSTIENTAALLRDIYPNWSEFQYEKYCSMFPIDRNGRIINMSKGMQRQAALILALSTCPDYLFLDEIFDGLDPVVRHLLKKVCLMHRRKVLMERDIDSLRLEFRKVQVAFNQVPNVPDLFAGINVVNVWRNGNVFNVTIRGTEAEFMPQLNALNPAYISAMPLTLEEIFISEMGAAGYDTNNIV